MVPALPPAAARGAGGVRAAAAARSTASPRCCPISSSAASASGTTTRRRGSRTSAYPPDLAGRVALLDALHTALDIADLADGQGPPRRGRRRALLASSATGSAIDWLRDRVVDLPRDDRWQALSRRALLEDIDAEHRRVTGSILETTDPGFEPGHAFEVWASGTHASLERLLALIDDVRTHGVYDLATLSVVLREIRALP